MKVKLIIKLWESNMWIILLNLSIKMPTCPRIYYMEVPCNTKIKLGFWKVDILWGTDSFRDRSKELYNNIKIIELLCNVYQRNRKDLKKNDRKKWWI